MLTIHLLNPLYGDLFLFSLYTMVKGAHKGKRLGRKARVARKGRKSGNTPEYASCSVKATLVPSGSTSFSVNTLYNKINTQLSDFTRANSIASNYQHFRMSKIAITFLPTIDTVQSAGGVSKVYLYYMIDKSGSLATNSTLEALKQMGARPKVLDEKPITVAWAPSVLTDQLTSSPVLASQPAAYKVAPWLSTQSFTGNPGAYVGSSVDHFGLYWYAYSLNGGTTVQYNVEIEVQFQFKKPLLVLTTSSYNAIPCVIPIRDNSSDGIADGRDRGTAEVSVP